MAAKIDLGKLSLDELRALRTNVDKAIAGFKDRKRADAMKEIQAIAQKHGLSVDEIVGTKGKKRKSQAAPKYRNPARAGETWSGKGRQPAWFKTAIAAGKSPESMAI